MRTTLATALLDDDSPATQRVMRAYWLAPRMSRPATITLLTQRTPITTHPLSANAQDLT